MFDILALEPITVSIILTAVSIGIQFALASQRSSGSRQGVPGFDRLSNTQPEGSPLPVVLGIEHETTPTLISVSLRTVGGKQSFDLLYAAARGQHGDPGDEATIRAAQRLKINGEPVGKDNFKDLEIHTRTGTSGQSAIAGFDKVGTAHDVGVRLDGAPATTPPTSFTHEMKKEADEVHILLAWQQGLYRLSDSKGVRNVTGGVKVEYNDATQPSDPVLNPWIATRVQKPANPDWFELNKFGDWYTQAKTTSPVRRQIEYRFPTKGRYRVRVSGILDNQNGKRFVEPHLASIIEVVEEARRYPGVVLWGLRGVVTDSLGGAVPEITVLQPGVLLTDPRTSTFAASANPILHAANVLENNEWGAATTAPALQDFVDTGVGSTWRAAMDRCDVLTSVDGGPQEAIWRLSYVLEADATWEDHLAQILSTCRAFLYEHDGLIQVGQDIAASSVRTFDARKVSTNRRNVLELDDGRPSFRVIPPPLDQQWNGVIVAYIDAEKEYEERTVTWPAGSSPTRPLELNLRGIIHRTQAIREARFQYLLATLTPNFLEWDIGIGDHDLLPIVDVVDLFDDYHGWSGKLAKVYAIRRNDGDGRGAIVAREYDADVYADDPVDSKFFKEEEGNSQPYINLIPKARPKPPPAQPTKAKATDITYSYVKEVKGTTVFTVTAGGA